MTTFLAQNWQVVFGGIGGAVIAAIVGAWAKSYFDKKSNNSASKGKTAQQIRAGSGSTNIQSGRDANVINKSK